MRRLATLAVTAGLAAACSGGPTGPATARTPTATSTPTGPATPNAPALDLSRRVPTTTVAPGVSVASCPGDAPLLCFRRGATTTVVELLSYPRSTIDRLRDDASPAALRAWAGDYLDSFAADRGTGCPAGYSFTALAVEDATVFRRPGVRYGFEVRDAAGRPVERTAGFASVAGTELRLATTSAFDTGACVDAEGATTTPRQLADLSPVIGTVVAAALDR